MKKITCFFFLLLSCYISQAVIYKLTIVNKSGITIRDFKLRQGSVFYKDYNAGKILINEPYISKKKFVNTFSTQVNQIVSVEFSGGFYTLLLLNDSNITIIIDNTDGKPSLSFSGIYSNEYNYFILKEKEFPEQKVNSILYNNRFNANAYKKSADSIYKLKLTLARNYIRSKHLSVEFHHYVTQDINSDYINNLYNALFSNKFEIKNLPIDFFHLSDSLIGTFKPFVLTGSVLFSLSNKYIFFAQDVYTQKGLKNSYNTIRYKFTGKTKEYLLTNLIGYYAKKQSQEYYDLLLKKITEMSYLTKDTLCLNYIKDCNLQYRLLNKYLPDEVLENTYLRSYADDTLISLKNLLKTLKDKPLYIDFWANWCVACREDIAVSGEAKTYLKDKGVIYLYISIDKPSDVKKWKDASLKDSITDNQYLLINGINSPFGKFMSLTSIPRYLLLDNSHKIKSYDAPRPTQYKLNELKQNVNEALGNKITFNYY